MGSPCSFQGSPCGASRRLPQLGLHFTEEKSEPQIMVGRKAKFEHNSLKPLGDTLSAVFTSLRMPHLGWQAGSAYKHACHTRLMTSSSTLRIYEKVEATGPLCKVVLC